MPRFTIVLPIHRPPVYLPLSVNSVLSQDLKDFELFIVLDGAPQSTFECALSLAEKDSRIKVFNFPKGKRHGEAHRAEALMSARGEIITHINDDSLWMPDHLSIIWNCGKDFDFGHTLHTSIGNQDSIYTPLQYVEDSFTRERMLNEQYCVASICDVFYKRSAYESLPEKWTPAPEEIITDLYMWRKFFKLNLRFGTIYTCSSLFFDYPKNFSDDDSQRSINEWLEKIQKEAERTILRERVMRIHAKHLHTKHKKRKKPHQRIMRFFQKAFSQLLNLLHIGKNK